MRYRIPAVLIAVMALIGLSAPIAFAASSQPSAGGCTPGQTFGPFHIVPNDTSTDIGIGYHGPGNLITLTDGPGDSTLVCVSSADIYVIHNNAGNCIRMRDASNDYTVMEESGCTDAQKDDTNYQFQLFTGNGGFQFKNIHFGRWLGVTCPPANGSIVLGQPNAAGNCVTWLLQ
jgi:hypothetical protein